MNKELYLYPLSIRIWHFINAILIIVLILTGVSMQYSDLSKPFIRFDLAVTLHNISGIILTINYLLFVIANIISGNARQYRIKLKGLVQRLYKQINYYTFGLFKGEQAPFPVSKKQKFNPVQQATYFMVMFLLVPAVFVTGLSLLYSGVFVRELFGARAYFYADILHIIFGFLISVFLVIHIYFCTVGHSPLSNFKSIITGYHESGH